MDLSRKSEVKRLLTKQSLVVFVDVLDAYSHFLCRQKVSYK